MSVSGNIFSRWTHDLTVKKTSFQTVVPLSNVLDLITSKEQLAPLWRLKGPNVLDQKISFGLTEEGFSSHQLRRAEKGGTLRNF